MRVPSEDREPEVPPVDKPPAPEHLPFEDGGAPAFGPDPDVSSDTGS